MTQSSFLTPQQYFRIRPTGPRKRFGQHFLAQAGTAERIVESAHLEPSDVVVEIGPGLGALTRFIISKVRILHLVELDRDLAEHLESVMLPSDCRVSVYQKDVLTFDLTSLYQSEGRQLVVLGNLPYNITSPLMFHILESRLSVCRAVFMVQKEVGKRLAAHAGTKDYGVLSVLLGCYARVVPLFTVGPSQFYPPPKVESLVIGIDFSVPTPPDGPSFQILRKVVNAAFQQRRKTLQNSLKSLMSQIPGMGKDVYAKTGIDPTRRPETLSPDEFFRLARAFQDGLGF